MREDLQRRISAALDTPQGLDADADLREVLASDPDAAAYARDLARLERMMASWPIPSPSDDEFEALARRIDASLEGALDDGLEDPTLAPEFDDDDDLRDATAGLLGPVVSSSEIDVEDLQSVPPPAPVVAAAISTRPPPPVPRSAPPPPREIPKLAPAAEAAGDRVSFPMVPLAPGAPSLEGASVRPLPQRERRRGMRWFGGLAAAAAIGLGVVATTQIYQGEDAAMPASAVSARQEAAYPQQVPAEEMLAEATATSAAEAPAEAPAAAPAPPPGYAGFAAETADGARAERAARAPIAPAPVAPVPAEPRARTTSRGAARGGGGAVGGSRPFATSESQRVAMEQERGAPTATARPRASEPARVVVPAAPVDRAAPARASRATSTVAQPAGDLPAIPERGAVLASIQAVEPAVRACAEAEHGVAAVRIVVAGSGRVTTATVTGQFAGTPVGSCVARAVRTARFPAFSNERFEVNYPFQI